MITVPFKDKQKQMAFQKQWRAKRRKRMNELKNKPCSDCRIIFHHAAMDFDHIEDNKVSTFNQLIFGDWTRLLKEIAKCELVCSNCHRVRSYTRRQHIAKKWTA